MNVLLVAGSRDLWEPWLDLEGKKYPWYTIGETRRQAMHIMDNLSYVHDVRFHKIIHGGARGVDQLAGDWAKDKGYDVEVFPAEWDVYGKKAGFIRNAEMVKLCTHAIVLWDGYSAGTGHTVKLLKNVQKPLALYTSNAYVNQLGSVSA